MAHGAIQGNKRAARVVASIFTLIVLAIAAAVLFDSGRRTSRWHPRPEGGDSTGREFGLQRPELEDDSTVRVPIRGTGPFAASTASTKSSSEPSTTTTSIRGRVLLPDGAPAVGETVRLVQSDRDVHRLLGTGDTHILGEARVNGAGEFLVRLAKPQEFIMRVRPRDPTLAESILTNLGVDDDVLVVLQEAGTVRGTLDPPVAEEQAAWFSVVSIERYGRMVDTWMSVSVGATYQIGGLNEGEHVLTLFQQGVAPRSRVVAVVRGASAVADFGLDGLASTTGWISDSESHKPVPWAEVDFQPRFTSPVRCDARGAFSLSTPRDASAGLVAYARAEGYATSVFRTTPTEGDEIMVRLDRETPVVARVVDTSGAPLAGADATVFAWEPGELDAVAASGSTSNDSGIVRIRNSRPDGSSALVVRLAGYGTRALILEGERTSHGEVDLGDIVLTPASGVVGRVVGRTGEGLPGLLASYSRVDLQHEENTLLSRTLSSIASSERMRTLLDGRFYFRDLEPGRYIVRAVFDEPGVDCSSNAEVHIPEGPTPVSVELTVPDGLELSGRLLGCAGAGIEGAYLILYPEGEQLRAPAGRVATGKAGEFRFHGLSPGWYQMSVQIPQHLREDSAFDHSAGGLIQGIAAGALSVELQLECAEQIRGFVLDLDGTPVAGAFVVATSRHIVVDWTRSDASGEFSLSVAETCDLTVSPAVVERSEVGDREVPDKRSERKVVIPSVRQGTMGVYVQMPFRLVDRVENEE